MALNAFSRWMLTRRLGSKDDNTRFAAVMAARNAKDPAMVQPLLARLHDNNNLVSRVAVEALGEIGHPSAVDELCRILSLTVDAEAVSAAFERDPSGGPLAQKAATLLRDAADPTGAQELIAKFGNPEHRLTMLMSAVAALKSRAATALGKIGDRRAVAPLICCLDDTDEEVRRAARAALAILDPDWERQANLVSAVGAVTAGAMHASSEHASTGSLAPLTLNQPEAKTGRTTATPASAPRHRCARCDRELFTQREFLDACRAAGLHVDAQGRVVLNVGGIAGSHQSVVEQVEAQRAGLQRRHDSLEEQKGFQCTGCKSTFCTDCLFNHAPTHPQGGKACPSCGGRFTHLV